MMIVAVFQLRCKPSKEFDVGFALTLEDVATYFYARSVIAAWAAAAGRMFGLSVNFTTPPVGDALKETSANTPFPIDDCMSLLISSDSAVLGFASLAKQIEGPSGTSTLILKFSSH